MLAGIVKNAWWKKSLVVFQWAVPFLSIYFIWYIITIKHAHPNFQSVWTESFTGSYLTIFLIAMSIMTTVNILLESEKWHCVLGSEFPITRKESLRQTFLSLAAGFVTPFRSGALLARFITNEKMGKKDVLEYTLKMASIQFSITVIIGLAGWIYYFSGVSEKIFLSLFSILFIVPLLFYFLYRRPVIIPFAGKNWIIFEWNIKLILLSAIRYVFFTTQYVIILLFFGVEANVFVLYSLVAVTFLLNTLLPAGVLGKLGVRELSGILIIGESTGFVLEVSCAAFFIWMLNQGIPALIGSALFLISNRRSA